MALQLTGDGDQITVADLDLGAMNPDPEAAYTVALLTREAYKRIFRANTKKQVNPESRRLEDVTDMPGVMEDLLDAVLVGWTGILAGGVEAPCVRENKLKLDAHRAQKLVEVAGYNQVAGGGGQAASFRGA